MWRWRARGPHTHSAPCFTFQTQLLSSLIDCRHSFRWSFGYFFKLFRVLLSPGLRDPAALVEEFSDDHNVEAKAILGHPHPVHFDAGREVLPAPDCVAVNCLIVGDDEGTRTGALQFRNFTIPQLYNSATFSFNTILVFWFSTFLDLLPPGHSSRSRTFHRVPYSC